MSRVSNICEILLLPHLSARFVALSTEFINGIRSNITTLSTTRVASSARVYVINGKLAFSRERRSKKRMTKRHRERSSSGIILSRDNDSQTRNLLRERS